MATKPKDCKYTYERTYQKCSYTSKCAKDETSKTFSNACALNELLPKSMANIQLMRI